MTQHHQGEEVRRQAESAAHEVRDAAGRATQQAKDAAGMAMDQGKRKAAEYTRQAKDKGMQLLDEQKHNAASQLHTVGETARRAAGKFRDDHDDNIAGYVDAVADEVERMAGYLERRDMGSLARDAQNLARRRPELFLGGMFVAGLALMRFLKASQRREGRAGDAREGREQSSGHYAHRPDPNDTGVAGSTFDQVGTRPTYGCGGSASDLNDMSAGVVSSEFETGGPIQPEV